MADPRFDTSKDPRFKQVPARVRRLNVDKRFAHMFEDKSFVETTKVDARGQRQRQHEGKNKLRQFYRLTEDDKKAAGTRRERGSKRSARRKPAAEADDGEAEGEDAEEVAEPDEKEENEEPEEEEETDDDNEDEEKESESSEDEEEVEEPVDSTVWEFADPNVPKGDGSRRLAIMNCDWDHISAQDILVMLRTYLSSKEARKGSGALRGGSVDSVRVYPSDYGLARLAKENVSGPTLDSQQPASKVDRKLTEEQQEAKLAEALRRYQLEKLKYYYAVAECDSVATACWLYDCLDGLETNGISPTMLDLRFVPDDIQFPHAPTSEATDMPKKYQGPAMQQQATIGAAKVKCTWDETPAQRKKDLMKKRFSQKELAEMDLQNYLASSSDEDDKDGAQALKSLVGDGDSDGGSDGDGGEEFPDMEATFSLQASKLEEELTEKVQKMGEKARTLKEEKPQSTWQQYLEKRKTLRKERKAKAKADRLSRQQASTEPPKEDVQEDGTSRGDLELMTMDQTQERGFNLRQSQRVAHKGGSKQLKKTEEEAGFRVDVNDPRIAQVFNSADFEIDPTNPEFRRSEGMGEVLRKKRQRKLRRAEPTAPTTPETGAKGQGPAASAAPASDATMVATGGLQLFGRRPTVAGGAGEPVAPPASTGRTSSAADSGKPKKKRKVTGR